MSIHTTQQKLHFFGPELTIMGSHDVHSPCQSRPLSFLGLAVVQRLRSQRWIQTQHFAKTLKILTQFEVFFFALKKVRNKLQTGFCGVLLMEKIYKLTNLISLTTQNFLQTCSPPNILLSVHLLHNSWKIAFGPKTLIWEGK